MSLYNPYEYAPFIKDPIMQPSCGQRMTLARDTVFSALLTDSPDGVEAGMYELQPLFNCSNRNARLPCARICALALYEATLPLQLEGAARMLEIARQSMRAA